MPGPHHNSPVQCRWPLPPDVGLAEGYRRAGETTFLSCQGTGAWFFCPHLPNISSRPASVVLPGQGDKEMLA